MKLSEMKGVLAARGWKLTKSLGQNFLHDQNQVRRMLAAAHLGPSDKVLEIGPGLGPLTELLIQEAGEVLAIEKDQRLFDFLAESLSGAPHLKLLRADALDHLKTQRRWAGWKLVANLPYSVASSLLVQLADAESPPDLMVATLQLEVAQRIDAATGSGQYGVFGLLLVDSACVTLERRTRPLLPAALEAPFTRIVKRGFSQRRKMMLKLLKQDWPEDKVLTAFAETGLPRTIRAEDVSLEQFARLTELLVK